MDSIKLETSTLCGNTFCEVCILSVINVQIRCLICWVKLKLLKMSIIFTYNITLIEKILKMGVLRVAMAVVCTILCVCMFFFFVLHLSIFHNMGFGIGNLWWQNFAFMILAFTFFASPHLSNNLLGLRSK